MVFLLCTNYCGTQEEDCFNDECEATLKRQMVEPLKASLPTAVPSLRNVKKQGYLMDETPSNGIPKDSFVSTRPPAFEGLYVFHSN